MLHTLGLLVATAALAPQQAAPIPLDSAWELSGESRVEELRGHRAIRLRSGQAVRRDVSFEDGTIEFDLQVAPRRAFVFVQFRMADDGDYEEVYFRPHKSSLPDALQYDPVWHGEGNWQLFHGPDGTASYTFTHDAWTHVRLVVDGRRAALFLGAASKPAMDVQLARDPAPGYLAFSSFVPDGGPPDGGEPAAAIANVIVRPGRGHYAFPHLAPDSLLPGHVTRWQLSPPFAAAPGPVPAAPSALLAAKARWPVFAAEPNGVLAIGRHLTKSDNPSATAARLVLRAQTPGLQRLELGYSDFVTVLVNGRPLFAGDSHYSFDRPRQEGLIGLWQAVLWLPLHRGDNEVLLLVSDVFGGWGLTARLDPSGPGRLVRP